jgi:hypothetical protein
MSLTDEPDPLHQTHPTGDRRAELERIRDAVWPPNESPAERRARIALNVAAWENRPKLGIDPTAVKAILEDPDNEYYGS